LPAEGKGDASMEGAEEEIVGRKRRMNGSHLVLGMALGINFVGSGDD